LIRLKRATDFERVRRDGRSHAHPLVVLIAWRRVAGPAVPGQAAVPPDAVRAGVVAGKNVGTAVDRNRAKRLLREALRACAGRLAPGWDLMLIARRPLAQSGLPEARPALEQLLRRARVLMHDV
jgi:ribonuclease P protein component